MNRPVRMYDLAPSPNNIKVRLALAYKKIPYERIPVDFEKREPLVKISGQPLAPVLAHGDTVIFDSAAILRYLEANFPSTPRLFSADYDTMHKIEEWELFGRTDAAEPIRITFREMRAASTDAVKLKRADELINRAASRVEEALAKTPYLMGEAPNAADFSVAPILYYGALPKAVAEGSPFTAFFHRNLKIERAPKTLDWIQRVMALDH